MKDAHYDVAILGSGIAGGTLGLILARAGVRVLILEKDTHPKFAVGESTIPQTSMMFEFMAKRFNAPELHHLGSYWTLSEHVSSMCGIKKGFNYIYHSPGKHQNPDHQNQTILNPEIHLYRQPSPLGTGRSTTSSTAGGSGSSPSTTTSARRTRCAAWACSWTSASRRTG
jgi:FADH2 O2-dependent halogenase